MDDLSEDQFVRQAKEGDVEAFAVLSRRYQERIFRTILGLTKNHLDADDLAQETFMVAFKSLQKFKQNSSFYTWLYRIAVNRTLNFLKRARREKKKTEMAMRDFSGEEWSAKTVSPPEQNSLSLELRAKIKKAVDSLPLSYRAAFLLVEFEGMLHKEAAYVLECSENTVAWRLHKARKILQTKLRPYLERGE
ncbi:MAG: sigma-70 family RNA polymerase sigma factor [Candidatus Aminicenantes bacterium]|jgi:RNA polymerase sigma-70 factor (ECF subfamily)